MTIEDLKAWMFAVALNHDEATPESEAEEFFCDWWVELGTKRVSQLSNSYKRRA